MAERSAAVRAVQIDEATMQALIEGVTQRILAREDSARASEGEGNGLKSSGR